MAETPLADRPTALYRFFGTDGRLLYIGIAVDPEARWAFHRSVASWWTHVDPTRTTVEWYQDRMSAESAEARAIKTERPQFNITHADPSGRPWRRSLDGAGSRTKRRLLMSQQELRAQVRATAERIASGQHVAVTRHGKPVAVLVPMDWYRDAAEKTGEPTDL